jgi:hypothetical protein
MLQLVVMVLNDVAHLEGVLDAWTREGARGITVLHKKETPL